MCATGWRTAGIPSTGPRCHHSVFAMIKRSAAPDDLASLPSVIRSASWVASHGQGTQIRSVTTIRRAKPDEIDALVELWLDSVRATHTFLREEDIQFFLPQVRTALVSEALELWVACSDSDTLVGFMGLAGNSIEALFLGSAHLRAGHGKRLV